VPFQAGISKEASALQEKKKIIPLEIFYGFRSENKNKKKVTFYAGI
jgi:hypothetical protein